MIGVIAGAVCFYASTEIKRWLGYDNSLDVFGVHGVGGIVGTILTGVFATAAVSVAPDAPNGFPGLLEGNPQQLLIQLYGVGVTVAYCAIVHLDHPSPRLSGDPAPGHPAKSEIEGLDIAEHGGTRSTRPSTLE